MLPRYPVYVPSKGRHRDGQALTVRALARDHVPFRLVVVAEEEDLYRRHVSHRDQLIVLPETVTNLLETRNWIRDHAEAEGHERHWQLDDNMSNFYRLWEGRRIPVHGGVALRVCEDLSDRFTNVGVSGLNYTMFVPFQTPAPFLPNVHVYSCTLVNHAMPYRWRLVYNDDTDLCLQALTNGWATIQVSALNAHKQTTMMSAGGNTDSLYRDAAEADHRDTMGRYQMAVMLERAWPGTVKVKRSYGRYQHAIDWKKFDVPLLLREDVDLDAFPEFNEYGMILQQTREVRSERVRALLAAYPETLAAMRSPSPFWRGLPAFRARPEQVKLRVEMRSNEERDALVGELGVTVDKKFRDKGWSACWPPEGRNDYASLRFEPTTERQEPVTDVARIAALFAAHDARVDGPSGRYGEKAVAADLERGVLEVAADYTWALAHRVLDKPMTVKDAAGDLRIEAGTHLVTRMAWETDEGRAEVIRRIQVPCAVVARLDHPGEQYVVAPATLAAVQTSPAGERRGVYLSGNRAPYAGAEPREAAPVAVEG